MKKCSVFLLPLFLFLPFFCRAAEKFLWNIERTADGAQVTLRIAENNYVSAASVIFHPESVKPLHSPVPQKSKDGETLLFNAGSHVWYFKSPLPEKVSWQGCSAAGLCFLPEEISFAPGENKISASDDDENFAGREIIRSAGGFMDKAEFLTFLDGDFETNPFGSLGLWGIIFVTLLGGMALNLTPCVLPMIPVNLAVIGASGGRSGFMRGLFYGSGMAVVYGVLGVLSLAAGVTFGSWSSTFTFNIIIALLFFALALSTAGFFQIQFSRLFNFDRTKLRGSGNFIAFILGGVAALLAGACVAPVLVSVLLFAAGKVNSGSPWAALLPFLLGAGMGLPWPLAGMGLSLFPRPGRYMVMIKYIFALVIAAVGVYYLYTALTLLPGGGKKVRTEAENFALLEQKITEAEKSGKPLLVEFTASWCKNCSAMDKSTLRDAEVKKILAEKFVFVKFYAEDPALPQTEKLLDAWKVSGFPAFVIIK